MPTPESRAAVHVFLFSYLSAAFVIALFASGAFALTVVTIHQEVQTRLMASAMNQGMIRSQRLLRNAIIFIGPRAGFAEALSEMDADVPPWEAVHTAYTAGALGISPSDFSSSELAQLKAEDGDYQIIRAGLHTLLAVEPRKLDKPTIAAISDIFYREPHYFSALYSVFTTLNTQADAYVARAQQIDTLIYVGTLLTILLEFVLVIRPANSRLRAAMKALAAQKGA